MLGLEPRNPEGADLQSAAVAAVPHPQLPYSCLMRSISVRLKRKQWNVTTRSRACQQKRSNTRVRAYLHHSLTSTCALACCSNAGSIPTHMKRDRCRGPQAPWSQRQESAVGGADRIRFGPPALARCAGRRSRVASAPRLCRFDSDPHETGPLPATATGPQAPWSQRQESNLQPTDYKSVALPLSHAGALVQDTTVWRAGRRAWPQPRARDGFPV